MKEKKFTCRKCGCHDYRKSWFKIKGKSMIDYRHKLFKQNPVSVGRIQRTVVCLKCKHRQRISFYPNIKSLK